MTPKSPLATLDLVRGYAAEPLTVKETAEADPVTVGLIVSLTTTPAAGHPAARSVHTRRALVLRDQAVALIADLITAAGVTFGEGFIAALDERLGADPEVAHATYAQTSEDPQAEHADLEAYSHEETPEEAPIG